MKQPKLCDLDFLPTNSHALIRALKADLADYTISRPVVGVPLDIHYAQIQRHAGSVDLVNELFEMMEEDLAEQDADSD